MMKKLFLLIFAAFAFATCGEDANLSTDPKPVTGITLELKEATIDLGETLQLVVTIAPADADKPVLVWKSDDTGVVTVSDKGLVTSVAGGATNVWVECGEFKEFCRIVVRKPQITKTRETIFFDAAQLGEDGYLWGKPLATEDDMGGVTFNGVIYTEGKASFASYFSDFGGVWDTWCRFAVSNCHDKVTNGLTNQFSVYTTAPDAENKFAAAYCMNGMGPGYTFNPVVDFALPVNPVSLRLANNTFTYLYLADKYADFTVSVIGFDGETQTGKVDVSLSADNKIVADWIDVDLQKLGEVTQLVFTVECADVMAPTYFCMDNLTYNY